MYDIDVSVIMPVYNAEQFLEQSIMSSLNQSGVVLELLCIDDGSSDGSLSLLEEYSDANESIRVFKQNHSGAGAARNLGLSEAKGEFVAFLDADDYYVEADALYRLVRACRVHKVDICGGNICVLEDERIEKIDIFEGKNTEENGIRIDFAEYQNDFYYQAFIFKKKLLDDFNIVFPNYLRYQDPPFMAKAMSTAQVFCAVPTELYCYRYGHQDKSLEYRHILDILRGIKDVLDISIRGQYRKLMNQVVERLNTRYLDAILKNLSNESLRLLLTIDDEVKREGEDIEIAALKYLYDSYAHINMCHEKIENIKLSNNLLDSIVTNLQNGGFANYFKENGINRVVVYGLGHYGRILIGVLRSEGVEIAAYVDAQIKSFEANDVLRPDDDTPKCDCVIVSMINCEDVIAGYKKKRDKGIRL